MKEKIEAKIAELEKLNKERGAQIQMHGQMKEQLINRFIETQGAIVELKKLIGVDPDESKKETKKEKTK